MRSHCVRRACTVVVASVLAAGTLLGSAPSAGRALVPDPPSVEAATAAAAWLVTQQQPDGGFDVAMFPGFETADAVLAIAAAAQTPGAPWSTAAALAAVTALEYGGPGGPTPLHSLYDWADSGINAGEAGKIILLAVAPLGLDPASFWPPGKPAPIDLAAIVDPAGCAGDPAFDTIFFLELVFAGLAKEVLCGAPNPAAVAAVRAAQRADGGWNYLGDPDDDPFPADSDVDTTALGLHLLVAAGAAWDDPAVTAALRFLAAQQSASGAFRAFGEDDPNATAVAAFAITAAGFDPRTSCWRDTVLPDSAGPAYADPLAWLRSQQLPDGRVASPNDGFGVNTFATAQTVQALLLSWWPVARATGAPTCTPTDPTDPAGPAGAVVLVPRFTG